MKSMSRGCSEPDGGDQHHACRPADDDRAAGLLGPLAGLDGDLFAADDGGLTNKRHDVSFPVESRRRALVPVA